MHPPLPFIRPVAEGTGRVARFELIPLAELGRPRIDVLCNMSGIFRDSFQVRGLGNGDDSLGNGGDSF